jgi:hypothetical protein
MTKALVVLGLAAGLAGLARPAQAKLYDREDRERRVARGEKLPWNVLDDFYGYPVAEPEYRESGIYTWAAALQACFSLAGYDTSQEEIIASAYGYNRNSWYFSPRNPPRDVYGPAGAASAVHFHCTALPGHFSSDQVIACIDHGSPVVLLVDDSLLRGADPLAGARVAPRYVTIYGYAWEGDPQLPVRTLMVDVYDAQPSDGDAAGSVRVALNTLAPAWAVTLTGNLVSGRGRLGISRERGA